MIRFDAAYIEIEGEDPERLAGFYERLFGLAREGTSPEGVVLAGSGLRLRVRRTLVAEPRAGGAAFGFVLAADTPPDAARDDAVAAGAIVLSESKREGAYSLVCQDPAGNEFTFVARAAGAESAALARVERPAAAPAASPAGSEAVRPAPPPRAVTRRDWDRLHDEARLAAMKESIAGLDMAFTPDDPAGVLDEMRAKIGAVPTESELDAADELMRAREREAAVDEALRRYQSALREEPPAPPARSGEPETADGARPRTLGRSAVVDDEASE